jgi:tetratricopeptide (TPR) repeat protein
MHKLIEITKKVGGPVDVPSEYAQLSFAYFMQGQNGEAEVAAQNALEEAERAGLNSQPVVLLPLKILGDIYTQKGEVDKATDVFEKLYNVVEPRKLVRPEEFAYAAAKLGDIYRRQDKLDYAERYYRQAIDAARGNYRQDNMFVAKALYGLGLVLAKEGNNKDAEEVFRESLPMCQKIQGPRSALAGACRKQLQEVLWKTNWISAIMFRVGDQK